MDDDLIAKHARHAPKKHALMNPTAASECRKNGQEAAKGNGQLPIHTRIEVAPRTMQAVWMSGVVSALLKVRSFCVLLQVKSLEFFRQVHLAVVHVQ